MAKPLSQLLEKVSPEVQAKASVKALEILKELTLAELRKEKGFTQVELAEKLKLKQPSIAQMEKQSDANMSTIKNYIKALGGTLEINALFPDGTKVEITQFMDKLSK